MATQIDPSYLLDMTQKILKTFQKHKHWKSAKQVCKTLNNAGFKAWFAGGCVRDALLGHTPKDFDIATDAMPDQVESLFPKTINVGKVFGVIRVIFGSHDFEVATFRRDGRYDDGRRPENVVFTDPEEDAKRRDFTVNALFYDYAENTVHDLVGGFEDLKKKIIRTVGDPSERFREDKLRILRAIRFVSQLGFDLDPATLEAIKKSASEIHKVSGERLFQEVSKLFSGKYFIKSIPVFEQSGLRHEIFPGHSFNLAHQKKVEKFKNASELRWFLVSGHPFNWHQFKVSREFQTNMETTHALVSDLKKFDHLKLSQKKKLAAQPLIDFALTAFEVTNKLKPAIKVFIKKNKKLPTPLVTSNLLKDLGIKQGPEFGKILNEAYDAQLEGQIKNKKEALVFLENKISD